MKVSVGVGELAEFVHRRGDLYPPLKGRTRADEGIKMQRLAQSVRGADYYREYAVRAVFELGQLSITVSGRVDGCEIETANPLVEEYKTTRAPAALAEQYLGSAHWAQATLYAALLAKQVAAATKHPPTRPNSAEASWTVRLLYCHPDTRHIEPFEKTFTCAELAEYLDDTLQQYGLWLQVQREHVASRNVSLAQREFPYPDYRPHQLAMARRVYRALRDGEHLLLEAPTGSGKTMGILYPALKSLADGHHDRLFFLTSRTTGALAVNEAVARLAPAALRYVEIIAKEKACQVPGMPCDAERCKYAHGYFDRIHGALSELLSARIMSPATVQRVAEHHCVCPFELSLDAARWADVIVGDYNYLLDPVVRLQRFADDKRLAVLIDESHQLADRARSMLSLELDRSSLQRSLAEAPPASLVKRIKSIDRALLKLRREQTLTGQQVIEPPSSLLRAIARCNETLAELAANETFQIEAYPHSRDLVFNVSRWVRAENWRTTREFCFLAVAARRNVVVSMQCLDPGPYLKAMLHTYGAHVRFSGTLTPLPLYQRLHGQTEASAERVESAFSAEQLSLLVVADLPVYLRQRSQTLSRLVDLVDEICQARLGNYLVALPSFDYLNDFVARYTQRHPAQRMVHQQPQMSDSQRHEFLASFPPSSEASGQLGVVVLGGVFGESVDFARAQLCGVICVGVGLPPPEPLREEILRHYSQEIQESQASQEAQGLGERQESRDANGAHGAINTQQGKRVAYLQPAMTKVLQMAGRLLRDPADRGVICLIDGRFREAQYQAFFPQHWRPVVVKAHQVPGILENFWWRAESLPRLASPADARADVRADAKDNAKNNAKDNAQETSAEPIA